MRRCFTEGPQAEAPTGPRLARATDKFRALSKDGGNLDLMD
jgi:hypothetical protein